jgi:hypothetical protein
MGEPAHHLKKAQQQAILFRHYLSLFFWHIPVPLRYSAVFRYPVAKKNEPHLPSYRGDAFAGEQSQTHLGNSMTSLAASNFFFPLRGLVRYELPFSKIDAAPDIFIS